ncbi:hypothetical protein AX15_005503 [Amanita polypyramis BW_CC]|nr:hypothetical protein AX15_005503 [Amanita polypyramis BW_CC]
MPDTRRLSLSFPERKKHLERRPSTAHYRPVSTILYEAATERQRLASLSEPRPRLSLRPLSLTEESIRDQEMIKDKCRVSPKSLPKRKLSLRSISPPSIQCSDSIFSPHNLFSKLRMKRSMSSLNPTTYNFQPPHDTLSSQLSPSLPMNLSSPDLLKSMAKKDKWIRKDYATLHPYSHEAPYMQAYDPILLDNDRYTNLLLRHLMPNGSPTFYDFGKKPPQSVLDLGSGLGHWVLYAADIWKTSQFTGFDLVDLTSHIEKPDNVSFVKGNFLKRRLPFASKQFDLVRMANLSLCIPQSKWDSLLTEVFRVLAVGGRLELIDDEIVFPYGPEPGSDSKQVKPIVQSAFDWDDDFDDDEDTLEDSSCDTDSTLIDDKDGRSEKIGSCMPRRSRCNSLPMDDFAFDNPSTKISTSSWDHEAAQCRHLETVFENMLRMQYDIHPRPSEFLFNIIHFIFGNGNVEKQRTFQLKLAPKNANEFYGVSSGSTGSVSREVLSDKEDGWSTYSSDSGLGFPSAKKSTINTEHNKKGKRQEIMSISDRVSAKAAGRLGITYSALAAATAATVRERTQTIPAQSPGLILWPSAYFPMPPSELEMHACKNLHVLLGCKHALEEYMHSFKEEDGSRYIDDGVFSDILWEYECFRRRRFHWPIDIPGTRPETKRLSDTSVMFKSVQRRASAGRPRTSAESAVCPYTEDEVVHIRTIHVYVALKTDDYSLASLQYPRYPTPSPPNLR